jgi:hypothetical protein
MLSIRCVFPAHSSRRDLLLLLSSRWAAGWFKTIKFFEGIIAERPKSFLKQKLLAQRQLHPM